MKIEERRKSHSSCDQAIVDRVCALMSLFVVNLKKLDRVADRSSFFMHSSEGNEL